MNKQNTLTLEKLQRNSDWIDNKFPNDDDPLAQWLRAQIHATTFLYQEGELEATVSALSACVGQLCAIVERDKR